MSDSKGIKKGISLIFGVNILSMFFSLLMNFLLPKFLKIDTYATIQSYNLYIGFSGLFTLGFTDGIYLKYGGDTLSNVDSSTLKKDLSTFRIFQSFLIVLGIIAYVVTNDIVILFAGLALFPLNMTSFFSLLFQATGEFGQYSKITGLKATITFFINSFFLLISLIFSYENALYFLLAYLLLNVVYWIVLEKSFIKSGNGIEIKSFEVQSFCENIKNGLPLTLGTFTSVLFTSVDRWFIKILLNNIAFAYYSFAVSIDNFLNTAISPVTITLYNYLCNNKEVEQVKKLRRYVIIFVSILASCSFCAKFIIQYFISKYEPAIDVLFWLFAGKILYVIIQAIYVNLYKAIKKQNVYFRNLVIVTIVNIVINYLFFLVIRTSVAFAVGTMFSNVIWFVLCIIDFKEYRPTCKELIHLVIITFMLLVCGITMNSIIGFLIYFIVVISCAYIFMKKELLDLLKELTNMIFRKNR